MRRILRFALLFCLLLVLIALWQGVFDPRSRAFFQWSRGATADLITVQRDPCTGAPFVLPADGFIGLLYRDPRGPYSRLNPHQGIDIFVETEPGQTPVYAAYDGYISRDSTWTSTLIQRVPDDPLNAGQQIWLYYTHMADEAGNDFIEPAFERGTREQFVPQGTLLGYVGNYDGNQPSRIWTHLHFSIVRDDGAGSYLNELDVANTVDPTPYLKMQVNHEQAEGGVVRCMDG